MIKYPFVLESDNVMYVDIDETLVLWEATSEQKQKYGVDFDHFGEPAVLVPHKKHIQIIKNSKARGHTIVFWSQGGYEWCKQIVTKLGLLGYADAILSKPKWFLDDLPSSAFMPEANRIYKKDEE